MNRKILNYLLLLIIFLLLSIIYLSYFGIETKRFNQIIKEKINESNKKINIELDKVKLILNLTSLSIGLKTNNPNLIIENKAIKIKTISTSFSISPFLKKEFAIKKVKIATKENSLKDIIKILRIFNNSPHMFIINKSVKEGNLVADIDLNFDDQGELTNIFDIKGSIKNGKIGLLNKKNINIFKLDFHIKDKEYLLKDSQIEYDQLKLLSKKITIKNKNKYFIIEGDIKNPVGKVNSDLLRLIFKNNLEKIDFDNFNFSSENDFSFKLNKKFKISDFKINSKIDLKKLIYKEKNNVLKSYIANYKDFIELANHKVELLIDKKGTLIKGNGKFLINNKIDSIDYEIKYNKDLYNFKSQIQFNNIPLEIKIFNYTKQENRNSSLNIEGSYKKDKSLFFKNIIFSESENNFKINGLSLNENYRINFIDKIYINFLNDDEKKNQISLSRNKKKYELAGKIFDGTNLLDEILNTASGENVFSYLNNFNSTVKITLNKIFINDNTYLSNFNGILKFSKNNINKADLNAYFSDNKKLTFTINTNENNEKITTLFSEHAKPLVKKYKFIKGFEEGYLDFYSIKKNNISNSQLKIYDFKLNELPALTKILTLASLQGIADLLTGEGIRFNEFEMKFKNEKKLMTIDEIYAIGPAISILMDGYVENGKLISLRGTLVPATTLNKVIGAIPFLGNILVGKKTGEGVFGVSFKIKGSTKDLKTTVNPIKTLTPRFITRTLEKIKKENLEN